MVTKLKDIFTWTKYFREKAVAADTCPDVAGVFKPKTNLNDKVSLWKGDITELEIDAVVNAANTTLLGGGGVDARIHQVAGGKLLKKCQKLNGCETGKAKMTKGYNLPAKYVIHAVGPQEPDHILLQSAYKSSLDLALGNGIKTIAFPCISTGAFGFPREDAAHVALRTTRHFLEENEEKVERIIFATFLDEDLKIYERLMQRYFPIQ